MMLIAAIGMGPYFPARGGDLDRTETDHIIFMYKWMFQTIVHYEFKIVL
jgi:hypothetical protein